MINLLECIKFANENKLSYLATVDNDQPRVRAMGFWYADETGFYFQTGAVKELYKQLEKNPKVEICFYKHANPTGTMLRIAGKIDFVNDREIKAKLLADRPFLKDMGITPESSGLIIFRIAHGEAHFWRMEINIEPKEILKF